MKPPLFLSLLLLWAGTAAAQAPASSPQPAAAAKPAPTSSSPEPSELEKARLENLQLKFTLLDGQQRDLQSQYGALIQQIQAEHPGTYWDAKAGALKPIPAAKPATVKPALPAAAK